MTQATKIDQQEPIAIIGAACRLPGEVSSLGNLWDMISNVKTGHCKVPADRWDADRLHHPDPDRKGTMAVKHGYFLQQDLGHFDAPFFSTTAKEAASMDPMKRLLLEVSYESIENAGIPLENLVNSDTGCYVGCMTNDYELMSTNNFQDIGYSAATGTSVAMTSNRVSWFYGLRGPSLTLDTACSSSLYALHLACQSLKLGETNMSLVAGVNLILYPKTMQQFSAIHMLSPEGISHSFDDRANGYGRGEGIGCLVVKRLSDAVRDGDTIRAVIRNTGANADGKTPSITQPSTEAQAELIRATYKAAGLSLTSTQYFESHGTGTPVGDPIELRALASTIGAARREANLGPLYFGSIKPNVGHTEGCSGLAGVFKALLCLEKGMLVPTYGVENINPALKLDEWNLALPPKTMKWPTSGSRRVSINSFGFGGANAHIIIDDAYHFLNEHGLVANHNTMIHDDTDSESGISMGPGTPATDDSDFRQNKQLFVLSTRDAAGTKRISSLFSQELSKPELSKEDSHYVTNLAYTLSTRRTHHDFRTFAVASTLSELSDQLSRPVPEAQRTSKKDNNLVFVFTGQGAQWAGMGRQLLSNPIFADSVKDSADYLKIHGCPWDVIGELTKTEDSRIGMPEFSQTLCTVLQVALVDLLKHWNVTPKGVVGHSSGEIGAAYAAGFINHSDAVKIAYVRGICSAAVQQKGAMMAAGVSREEAQEYLAKVAPGSAVVACVNSPSSVTLSGDVDAIDTLEKLISADSKFARKLKVTTAYHSPHMKSIAEDYFERIGSVNTQPAGDVVMFSSLTGKVASPEELTARYWVNNMCSPVEFAAALAAMQSHGTQSASGRSVPTKWGGFVEVGPHAALQGPVQQNIAAAPGKSAKNAPYTALVLRGKNATETSLTAAGQLWTLGIDVDLSAVNGFHTATSIFRPQSLAELPQYPWNHSRSFWHEPYNVESVRYPQAPRTDLLGIPEEIQNRFEPRWRNYLRISENPWIEDHKITGTILYPGAGMLVMALEGALQMAEPSKTLKGFRFRDTNFERGLVVTSGDEAPVETRLSLIPSQKSPGQFQFAVYSYGNSKAWVKHCYGTVELEYSTGPSEIESATMDPAWAEQSKLYESLCDDSSAEDLDMDDFYEHLEGIGMEYGPLFRNMTSITSVPGQKACHGTAIIPDTKSIMPANFEYSHVIHPATMDAIFHLLLSTVEDGKPLTTAAVPYHINDMFVAADQPQGADSQFNGYSRITSKSNGGREIVGELIVSDDEWSAPKIVVEGFALRQVTSDTSADGAANGGDSEKKCARVEWIEDLDFISTAQHVARLQGSGNGSVDRLKSWLERRAHKTPISQMLVVADDTSSSSVEILKNIRPFVGMREGLENLTVFGTSEASQEMLESALSGTSTVFKPSGSIENMEVPSSKFDVVLALGSKAVETQSETIAKLHGVIADQGHLVVSSPEGTESLVKGTLESFDFGTIVVPGKPKVFIGAKASPVQKPSLPSEVYFLLPSKPTTKVAALASGVAAQLSRLDISTHSMTLTPENALNLAEKSVVSFLEIESPLIYSWNADQFAAFKTIVSTANNLFWITRGGVVASWECGIEFAPAQGLLRVMRNEYPLATLPHMDLSLRFDLTGPAGAKMVFDTWMASLAENAESEFAEYQGKIYIPRAVEDDGLDGDLQLYNGTAKSIYRSTQEIGKAMKLDSAVEGGDYLWVEDEESAQALEPEQVEIEVEYIGLNKLTSGSVDEETSVPKSAREAVGLITRCGSNVASLSTGQRVVVFGADASKTHIRQEQSLVAAVPAGVQPQEAAALPSALITAQYALVETAALTEGQVVLINGAASAYGQAAIQVSQNAGAEIFALVDSREEKGMLVEKYNISPARVYDSNQQYFVAAVKQFTSSRGVDVVFATQSSPAVMPSLDALGASGYFFDVGASTADSPQIVLPASKRNASLIRVDMDLIQQKKASVVKKLFQQIFSTSVKPLHPTNVFSIGKANEAVQAVIAGQNGAVVLSADRTASILTMPPPADKLALDPSAAYVLAGGLGVLGLDIANMMADHGAKHLVFLSRSGGSKNEKDLKAFQDRGVLAEAFKCDINDKSSVSAVFEEIRSKGAVVKGMIQCAMVLEDTIFDNMIYDKWTRAFRPKTQGSRNLLTQLRREDSPFYILLSSITGVIGNTAQANYASGNTFEDALAHYSRKHLGIPATSIDVGLVADSSHFTAAGGFGDLKDYLGRYSHGWVGLRCSHEELRVSLQAIMRGSTADGTTVPAQVVLGLGDQIARQPGSTGFDRDQKFNLRVVSPDAGADDGAGKGVNLGQRLSSSASLAEAAAAIEEAFKTTVAASFGIGVEEVDAQRPLPELGVDSLKAVEMRNRVLKEMQSEVSVFELLSATPLTDLSVKIATKSALVTVQS